MLCKYCAVWTLYTDELVVSMRRTSSSTPFAQKCYDLQLVRIQRRKLNRQNHKFCATNCGNAAHSVHALCNQCDRACRSSFVSLSTTYVRKYPRFNRFVWIQPVHVYTKVCAVRCVWVCVLLHMERVVGWACGSVQALCVCVCARECVGVSVFGLMGADLQS